MGNKFQKTNRINVLLILLCNIVGQSLLAQMPAGGMTPPEFNAIEKARLVTYDEEKVIKKLKIIEDSIINEVSNHIATYNSAIDDILLLHAQTLRDLEKEFDRNLKIAMQNRDRSQMSGVKNKIKEIIPSIRYEVSKHEKVLNESFKNVLTEKQFKKWLKYQKQNNPSSRTL